MSESTDILVSNLLFDGLNPRLAEPNIGQRDAHKAIAKDQQRKLVRLARDIVEHGINPGDLPYVMAAKDGRGRYIVLEGNRRLAALRGLENPDALDGALTPENLRQLRLLSKQYTPIDSAECVVFKDREEAHHWIELRHTGQNDGAGVVPWNTGESQRFGARTKGRDIHVQALDFLERENKLTPEQRSDVPITSLKRLLATPQVRNVLGIGLKEGELQILADKRKVANALSHVATDLASGRTTVSDIYNAKQRVQYAKSLPASVKVKATAKNGRGLLSESVSPAKQKKEKVKRRPPRDRLIPSDCTLAKTIGRIKDIEDELRELSLDRHSNAVSVLLRVFIELSVDVYIADNGLPLAKADLRGKLQGVVNHLVKRQLLSANQAAPVRSACQKKSFLTPSVSMMHAFIHSKNAFPAPTDLRAYWGGFQDFLVAIWS
jgi:hypothetical protein